MTLKQSQSLFQSAILSGGEAAPSGVEDGPRLNAAARFKIYSDAYRLRLAECLSAEYPALRERLGDEAFGALFEAYLEQRPSRAFAAQDYCRGLPDFMREDPDWRERDEALGLAEFERALSHAFDAPDAPQLAIEVLAAHSPEEWPELTFALHPSVRMIALPHAARRAYELSQSEPIEAADAANANDLESSPMETMLFWRQRDLSFYRALGGEEELALATLMRGADFGLICAVLAQNRGVEDVAGEAAGFLARWFADGLIAGVGAEPAGSRA
ncbi:conserved hypothetical protein [Methylocella silvestris BL2]|uniref:Putative DNA-binding domain-containing protein n=1 Tax=Methylocella silvestris (strain DSM 15510 / CIP 108128 / LMG 27833 / NCIMB 13906 / BL2) TaxID=395965 RepID=B8EJ85_METSB|nr:DNA-binding domain-containing protein [Methylocella silvestris]ACK52577.1 conserved hypothetical protein [Methylocella silvestris BL2]